MEMRAVNTSGLILVHRELAELVIMKLVAWVMLGRG